MFVVVAGGVILGAIGLGVLYDYQARRRGWRVGVSGKGAPSNARDVDAQLDPSRQERLGG